MAESLFKTKPWSFLLRAQRLMANKINTIVLQNLLAPFCFVLEKTLYGTFLCLAVSASSCKFNKKKQTKNKKLQLDRSILASLEAGWSNCLTIALHHPTLSCQSRL